jgi:hypothetical protein
VINLNTRHQTIFYSNHLLSNLLQYITFICFKYNKGLIKKVNDMSAPSMNYKAIVYIYKRMRIVLFKLHEKYIAKLMVRE